MSPREHGSAPRLDAILARAALSEPQREAVICRGSSWSYAEVYDRACRLAGLVAGLGVKKGDRVAFWAANRAEFLEVLFGVAMSGAISAPENARMARGPTGRRGPVNSTVIAPWLNPISA